MNEAQFLEKFTKLINYLHDNNLVILNIEGQLVIKICIGTPQINTDIYGNTDLDLMYNNNIVTTLIEHIDYWLDEEYTYSDLYENFLENNIFVMDKTNEVLANFMEG